MNKKYIIIYLLLFPNKKKYIGQTICHRFTTRMNEHKRGRKDRDLILYKAINKYGWDNIIKIKIAFAQNKEEADKIEINMIRYHDTTNKKYGYNEAKGGHSCDMSYSIRKKISKAKTGVSISQDHKNAISKGRIGLKQKPMSEQGKLNIKIAAIKRYNNNPHPQNNKGKFIKR